MASTLTRKAWTDLSRRRARSALTVGTIAIAIASLGMLALPSLMDRVMVDEVEQARLYDLQLSVRDLPLDTAQQQALADLPNVTAFTARVSFPTRVYIGDRREQVTVWGVDFDEQPLNRVSITSGAAPSTGDALSDNQNGANVALDLEAGDSVEVLGADGDLRRLAVTGSGRSLAFTHVADGANEAVLYADNETVRTLSGGRGFNHLEFGLADTDPEAVQATITEVRSYLREVNGGTDALSNLPITRASDDWPGREFFNQVNTMFLIITLLALVSALFLISNTMNTVVAEQRTEIAMMKAIGGRQRQIAGAFLRTALLLGALGALVGAPLGIVLAALLTKLFASSLVAVEAGFVVSLPVVAASVAVGIVITVLASLPGLRKGLRAPVRESLQDRGVPTTFGASALDRLTMHDGFLPRNAQIGLRSVGRQKRRTASTVAQIALAVATTLSLLGVGLSLTRALDDSYAAQRWDVWVLAGPGARPLDADAVRTVEAVAGVDRVDPVLINDLEIAGTTYDALGIGTDPLYDPDLIAGRWISEQDQQERRRVTVLSSGVARAADREVGDEIVVDTAGGPVAVEVIGIDSGQFWNLFVPLPVLQDLTGWDDTTNSFLLTTDVGDQASVDRIASEIEDAASVSGYTARTFKLETLKRDTQQGNDQIVQIIQVLGLLIVAIGMLGLINAMTMSILDRTREIGVLRCLGARSRDIRRMFATESVAVALLGWLIGVPLGYLLFRGLLRLVLSVFNLNFPPVFPPAMVGLVLVGTLLLALAVIVLPLRRATHLRPGDAIRYQ